MDWTYSAGLSQPRFLTGWLCVNSNAKAEGQSQARAARPPALLIRLLGMETWDRIHPLPGLTWLELPAVRPTKNCCGRIVLVSEVPTFSNCP